MIGLGYDWFVNECRFFFLLWSCCFNLKKEQTYICTPFHKVVKRWLASVKEASERISMCTFHGTWYVSRVVKYNKKSSRHLTMFLCLLNEGIAKIFKKLESHSGFLSYLQDRTANSANPAATFCPALVCPQKAFTGIKFLAYFCSLLVK